MVPRGRNGFVHRAWVQAWCLAGWATVRLPLGKQDYGYGVRVIEPVLSPHSSCWQGDDLCQDVQIKIQKARRLIVASHWSRLDGLCFS